MSQHHLYVAFARDSSSQPSKHDHSINKYLGERRRHSDFVLLPFVAHKFKLQVQELCFADYFAFPVIHQLAPCTGDTQRTGKNGYKKPFYFYPAGRCGLPREELGSDLLAFYLHYGGLYGRWLPQIHRFECLVPSR